MLSAPVRTGFLRQLDSSSLALTLKLREGNHYTQQQIRHRRVFAVEDRAFLMNRT